MSSHNDTRHIIDGATGGSSDDTTAYNDVTADGSQLTFTSINGAQKSVSVSGGGTAVQAYNSVSVSGNDIVFGKTDGSTADTQPLDGLTAITDLQTLTTGHTTDISTLNTQTATHSTEITTLTDFGLKSIEIDGNGDLRGKRHDNSYSGKVEHVTDMFYDATITGTNTLNLISNSGTTQLTLPAGGTTATSVDAITFNFTVQAVSGSDKYFLNGMQGSTAPLELLFMHKYVFTFPASHPLKLSRTPDGTHAGGTEWTVGVTVDSTTQITFVNQGMRLLENLYYYCPNQANMGGTIIEENGYNNITEIDYNTTTAIPQLELTRASGNVIPHVDHIPLSDSFVSAQKDGDNIKLTSISGTETTVGPFSGGGGGGTSTTNYPTSPMTSNSMPTNPATVTEPQTSMTSNSDGGYEAIASSEDGCTV
jgi:hypothetical protein